MLHLGWSSRGKGDRRVNLDVGGDKASCGCSVEGEGRGVKPNNKRTGGILDGRGFCLAGLLRCFWIWAPEPDLSMLPQKACVPLPALRSGVQLNSYPRINLSAAKLSSLSQLQLHLTANWILRTLRVRFPQSVIDDPRIERIMLQR